MALSKYARLKIAGNVLGFTMKEFAQRQDTYPQVIQNVAQGHSTSARLSQAINETIEKAERVYDEHRAEKQRAKAASLG